MSALTLSGARSRSFFGSIALFALVLLAACGDDASPMDAGGDVCVGDVCGCDFAGCPCTSPEGCASGRCDESICVDCPLGERGCACEAGVCDMGLACASTAGGEVCVDADCTPGQGGCPCDDVGECAVGSCSAGVCPDCEVSAVEGCPCVDTCATGFVCDDAAGACRMPLECTCEDNLACTPVTGADPQCGPECVAGARRELPDGRCTTCDDPLDCFLASCDEADAGSIVADCADQNRRCDALSVDEELCADCPAIGSCTECMPGFSEVGGECVEEILCGDAPCEGDEYCDTSDPEAPVCVAVPCPANEALSPGDACVACAGSCEGEGLTGRFWSFTDRFGQCICETLPDYFWDVSSLSAELCDADEDGWTREEVADLDESDPATFSNARCDVRAIDGVRLVDEYGIGSLVLSCEEGLLQDVDPASCTSQPLNLFETRRNDVPDNADLLREVAAYSFGGRALRAEELNPLTKACASLLGDFNDDGSEDIGEAQPRPDDTAPLGETARLQSFAHFVELYRTSFRPGIDDAPGTLVIAERSRCDESSLALGYGDDTSYSADNPDTYWRNCGRRRDGSYDADSAAPGQDFAQFSCGARSGSCPAPASPAHPSSAALPDDELLRGHGLCELGGSAPADGVFRGLNHASQFQCVRTSAGGGSEPFDRSLTAFSDAGSLVFNACQIRDCEGAMGCSESTDPGGIDAWDPALDCAATAPADGNIGWAASRYLPYGGTIDADGDGVGEPAGGSYQRGCINEDAEYPTLCPNPEFGYCMAPPLGGFGRYRCFGFESLFLWGGDTAFRSTLRWADDAAPAPNMSVWNIEPVPTCM